MRESIAPTHDSRETGPRYYVTTQLGDRTIAFRQPIEDPFVRKLRRLAQATAEDVQEETGS